MIVMRMAITPSLNGLKPTCRHFLYPKNLESAQRGLPKKLTWWILVADQAVAQSWTCGEY
jgi:hypothetical protein